LTGKPVKITDKPIDFVDKSINWSDKSKETRTSIETGKGDQVYMLQRLTMASSTVRVLIITLCFARSNSSRLAVKSCPLVRATLAASPPVFACAHWS
jgi:hypothetical protein